jgi:hypothetical protein
MQVGRICAYRAAGRYCYVLLVCRVFAWVRMG